MKKLKTFDSSYFISKCHFEDDGTQNYSVFQPINRYFKVIANTDYVSSWKSKGLSTESIKPPNTSRHSLTPVLSYYSTKTRVKLNGSSYLQQPKLSYTHGTIVNIYIVYELSASNSDYDDPKLENCLFGAVTLTKNADDIDKYRYSGYGIGFDRKSHFSFLCGVFGQNLILFRVDICCNLLFMLIIKKDILILRKGPIQGLEHTLTAEIMYSINFTVTKIFCLSLHYNGANSYLFVTSTEIYKFKAKDPEIVAVLLCI